MNASRLERIAAGVQKGAAAIQATRAHTIGSLEHVIQATDTLPVHAILPRIGARTRLPNLQPVIELTQSISAVGLLHNLVVDTQHHILCGEHRYLALRVLSIQNPLDRCRFLLELTRTEALLGESNQIQALQTFVDLDEGARSTELERLRSLPDEKVAEDSTGLALLARTPAQNLSVRVHVCDPQTEDERLAIEFLENQVRSNYTPAQIRDNALRLEEKGYKMGNRGRPSKEDATVPAAQRQVVPALAQMMRLSESYIRKVLKDPKPSDQEPKPKPSPLVALSAALRKLNTEGDDDLQAWVAMGLDILKARGA